MFGPPSPGILSATPPSTAPPKKPHANPCVSTTLGGGRLGGSTLTGLKSLPSSLLPYKFFPYQVPHKQHVSRNVLTKLIGNFYYLGAGESGLGLPINRGCHRFSPRSLFEGQGLEHCLGWLGCHRERALHSPATPPEDAPFLFGGCL